MDGFSSFPSDDVSADGQEVASTPRSRDSLFLLAKLTLANGDQREVRVRNLSAGGLMAELDGQVGIGDPVRVELRGVGEVNGRIAWSAEGRVGVALDQPIDPKKARKPIATRAIKR